MSQSFTKQFANVSQPNGYQFDFMCDHCGRPHRSSFIPAPMGAYFPPPPQAEGGKVKKAFGDIGRGISSVFENGLNTIGENRPPSNQPQAQPNQADPRAAEYEAAFQQAQMEVMAQMGRCPQCGDWVCHDCWDDEAGKCSRCVTDSHYASIMGGGQPHYASQDPTNPYNAQQPMQQAQPGQFTQQPVQASPSGGAAAAFGAGAAAGTAAGAAAVFSGQAQQAPTGFPQTPQAQTSSETQCPKCGKSTADARFCGWCAAPLHTRSCPKCGEEMEVRYPFCGWCGSVMEEPDPVCPKCGETASKGMKFCPECGTSLTGNPAPTAAAEPKQAPVELEAKVIEKATAGEPPAAEAVAEVVETVSVPPTNPEDDILDD